MGILTRKAEAKFETFKGARTMEFKFFRGNRDINKSNLKNIINSIRKIGQLHPILITSDGYILDGQHRYIALKELGYDIWYTINHKKGKEVIEEINNVHKHWCNMDRVKNQVEDNNIDIVMLNEQIDLYKKDFKSGTIMEAFALKKGTVNKQLKDKTYRFDYKKGTKVLKTCLQLKEITKKKSVKAIFVRAMCLVYRSNKDYSIEVMVRNAEKNKLHVYNSEKDTAEEIIEVYNYRQKKNRLSL